MRVAVGLVRTEKARACLSLTTQVLYSFCWMPGDSLGCTPPWQAGEAQEPGPVYFGASVCPNRTAAAKQNAMARTSSIVTSVLNGIVFRALARGAASTQTT